MISAPPLIQAPPATLAGFRRVSASSASRTVRCAVAVAPQASAASAGRCTLYEVLGLRAGATGREIKAAYRRLARERHPDAAGADGGDEGFIRLHHAYATLSDPDARARYDRSVVAHAYYARPHAGTGDDGGVWARRPRRTWETDQCW